MAFKTFKWFTLLLIKRKNLIRGENIDAFKQNIQKKNPHQKYFKALMQFQSLIKSMHE